MAESCSVQIEGGVHECFQFDLRATAERLWPAPAIDGRDEFPPLLQSVMPIRVLKWNCDF